jgi:hypothetical protein
MTRATLAAITAPSAAMRTRLINANLETRLGRRTGELMGHVVDRHRLYEPDGQISRARSVYLVTMPALPAFVAPDAFSAARRGAERVPPDHGPFRPRS